MGKAVVFVHDFLFGCAVRKKVQDKADGKARSANDGFAGHHLRVERDTLQKLLIAHDDYVVCQYEIQIGKLYQRHVSELPVFP